MRNSKCQVPAEYQSTVPAKLRDLATSLDADAAKLLHDAAAEIEGGEDAFAALVQRTDELQKKLAQAQRNLESAYASMSAHHKAHGVANGHSRQRN